jgi:hypothetical protein
MRNEIEAAFAAEGQPVESWGQSIAKAAPTELYLVVSFVAGATVGGAIYDAEKAALLRGLRATKRVLAQHGVGCRVVTQRPDKRPVIYLVPKGTEGDLALDALDADYDANPEPGQRLWLPGTGWASSRDVVGLKRPVDASPPVSSDSAAWVENDQRLGRWVEYWTEAGRKKQAEFAAAEAEATARLADGTRTHVSHRTKKPKKNG